MNDAAAIYSTAISLLAEARKAEARLPEEERERRKEERLKASEERLRQSQIIANKCPSCGGKLVRGKKDKRNDYKRNWDCLDCGSQHSV